MLISYGQLKCENNLQILIRTAHTVNDTQKLNLFQSSESIISESPFQLGAFPVTCWAIHPRPSYNPSPVSAQQAWMCQS